MAATSHVSPAAPAFSKLQSIELKGRPETICLCVLCLCLPPSLQQYTLIEFESSLFLKPTGESKHVAPDPNCFGGLPIQVLVQLALNSTHFQLPQQRFDRHEFQLDEYQTFKHSPMLDFERDHTNTEARSPKADSVSVRRSTGHGRGSKAGPGSLSVYLPFFLPALRSSRALRSLEHSRQLREKVCTFAHVPRHHTTLHDVACNFTVSGSTARRYVALQCMMPPYISFHHTRTYHVHHVHCLIHMIAHPTT